MDGKSIYRTARTELLFTVHQTRRAERRGIRVPQHAAGRPVGGAVCVMYAGDDMCGV